MTDGTVTLDFQYNADGIRTWKTVITASDHTHAFQTRVVAPTCTENGYTLHECVCGYSWQSAPVVSTGHTFTTTEVAATCTAHGYTLQECECGYGYQEGTSGHTFTDTVVAPTAEENGYTLHECTCGYSYQDTPVAALGITNSSASGNATNTKVYDYVYNGSSLTYLTVTTSNYGENNPTTDTLYFGNGTVTYNETVYYYVTNLQGDVVAIIDSDGNAKVQYTYDAWGKILSISGPMADTLGAVNPLTYRGYVYDSETDLYYVSSRYYHVTWNRFLNSDVLVSTGQGFLGNNMFAYCRNNPVCRRDISGTTDQECFDSDGNPLTDDDKRIDGGKMGDGSSSSGGNSGNGSSVGNAGSSGYTYSAPPGGGGTTSSMQVGNIKVTFGHGGRHVNIDDVSGLEAAIANDVVTQPPATGHSLSLTISYGGDEFTYRYFTLSNTHINIGTYYYTALK